MLLPPFQADVLDTHIMAIAPTNLVHNIIATPGPLCRYWRQGQTGGRLTVLLIAGAVPGVVAGCVIRAKFLPGMNVFDLAGPRRPGWRLCGARLQHRLPEAVIRRGLGVVVVAVGTVFLAMGLS